MIHNILSGQIVKGSCVDVMIKNFLGLGVKCQEINALTLSFYTTNPEETCDKTLEEVVIDGNCVTVHFEVGELDAMEDGVLRYIATYTIGEDEYTKEMETSFYLKTPINHKELNFITETELDEAIDEATKDMATIQDLEGLASEQWVKDQGYLTEHQSLEDYAKESWVLAQGFLTEHQDLSDYALKSEVPTDDDIINLIEAETVDFIDTMELEEALEPYALKSEVPSLDGYATEKWVEDKGYLTEHQDLSPYAKKTDIPVVPDVVSAFINDKGYLTEHQSLEEYALKSEIPALDEYATHDWVVSRGYLTEHQSLEDYAKESWVLAQGFLTQHQDLTNYAKKTDLPKEVSELINDAGYITEHQSLDDYYNKEDINQMFDNIENIQMVITAQLPETGRTNIIYLVPKVQQSEIDGYSEWIYLGLSHEWEKIGDTTANLQGYATEKWVKDKGYLTEHQKLKTINGQEITGTGNIVIGGGEEATYSAGNNISITDDHIISVTGITSYTGITSDDVTGALGFAPAKETDLANKVDKDNYLYKALLDNAAKWNKAAFAIDESNATLNLYKFDGSYAAGVAVLRPATTEKAGLMSTAMYEQLNNAASKEYVDSIVGVINNQLESI